MKNTAVYLFNIILAGLLIQTGVYAQTGTKSDRDSIDRFVAKAEKRFTGSKKKSTLIVEDGDVPIKMNFSYSIVNDADFETLKVNYEKDSVLYEEEFYYRDSKLVFVTERETARRNGEIIHEWSGVYYLDHGKLFDFMTNGHGKSETDDWEPEKEIPELAGKRVTQLIRILDFRLAILDFM